MPSPAAILTIFRINNITFVLCEVKIYGMKIEENRGEIRYREERDKWDFDGFRSVRRLCGNYCAAYTQKRFPMIIFAAMSDKS